MATIDCSIPFGGPLLGNVDTPDSWIAELKRLGYRAAFSPLQPGASDDDILAYKNVARENGIIIAEVGAWSNMVSPDETERAESIKKCVASLELADALEANCCVNVSGSRNTNYWAGPHKDNLTSETFDLIVEVVREVIDAVKPTRTFFALEAMPWAYPDSPDNYLRLIKAIDRDRFGVHLDPVNLVVSPQLFFRNGNLISECFRKLGPHILSCHGKDIVLREDNFIPQLDEVRPGIGQLDYRTFLTELARLKRVPLLMEHLETEEEYAQAAAYVRSVGVEVGVSL
ncbi:sugar phosphate isomerase/epimerase [Puniceicoccaceae bacterium K14]|nr:sugar phosphate isomerase/epimerase [Puniceicoccaceae bacterium K14]